MRGMLVVTLVVILAHRTALPDRLAWHQSQFVGYAEALALSLRTHLPAEVAEQIQLRNSEQFGKAIVLPRDSRGHYVARAWLNGMPVEALVDTGATMVMVPAHLQHKLSLEAGRSFSVNTATGQAMAQQTIIDAIKIGPVLLHDVEAALVPSPKDTVLVGMSFLLKTRFQQTTDGLLLEQGRASFE
jgi:aspartyl protease family protein